MNPLINILTRTSGRPNFFKVCRSSVEKQSYKFINHIVGADNNESCQYINNIHNWVPLQKELYPGGVNPKHPVYRHAPYNLYLNQLHDFVRDGWIMYLDDDDVLSSPDSIKIIVETIQAVQGNTDLMIFWRVGFPDGRVIPGDHFFGGEPKRDHITGIGFCFHSSYLKWASWDYFSCSDYRVISRLYNMIPNRYWIDATLTAVQRTESMGGSGKRDDK